MDKPFLDKLRKIDPYVPGEQPKTADIIKLNANENPYPPAPSVTEVLRTFDAAKLAIYPDANAKALKTAIAERFDLQPSQVFLGNGSDDVLALAFQSFFCSDKPILYPDITYSFYPVWCDLFRIPYENMPLDEDFCVNVRDYDKPNGGIVLPNPNAPTGRGVTLEFLEDLLQHNQDCVAIIDEAYVDFGGESCVSLTGRYPNLLVVQTYSKSRSMAGARLGYAMGDAALIRDLETIKFSTNPYNINRLTLKAGAQALAEQAYYDKNCQTIMETRDYTARELEKLGFTVLPSQSNFLFVRKPGTEGADIYRRLKERGVLVRHFDKERIRDYNRITIGTREQMDILLEKLREFL